MKQQLIGLSQRYVTALRNHLNEGPRGRVHRAGGLGRQAAALGLETQDLARMHERALTTLKLPNNKHRRIKRGEIFFAEAAIPIMETRRAARQGKIDVKRLNETLSRRTAELAASNRQLQRGIARHKVKEAAFKKNGKEHDKCLQESLQLQKQLRQLTHQVLAAQEDERKTISLELQNEIAQTLLGINVQLLSLKQEARSNTQGFKNKIAETQHSVVNLAESVRRFARELDIGPPA
jgi:signal transduction histidine kinase